MVSTQDKLLLVPEKVIAESSQMTPQEVAEDLHVSTSTLAQWRWLGRGPAWIKVGRHVRYPRAQYRTWLASGGDR
jgi:excisionase family DNA binding protein